MSDLSVNSILDASGGATTTINGFTPTVSNMAGRNKIINGGMGIDQRNAGASSLALNASYYLDRWGFNSSQNNKFNMGQNLGSVTPPAGFVNYLGLNVASSVSIGAGDYFAILQKIEGFNVADLSWGSANAKTVTLSFQVYSSLTGTFGGAIRNSSDARAYPFSYTISVANTWTSISVTIAGDTTGTWNTNSSSGIEIWWGLGAGSTFSTTANAWAAGNYISATGATSVVGTSGATFYITGVQLEEGSVATPFERRPVGLELALCQRYFEKSYNQDVVPGIASFTPGFMSSVTSSGALTQGSGCTFKVTKRVNPTFVGYNAVTGASGYSYRVSDGVSVATSFTNIGMSAVGYIDVPSSANGYYWHYTAAAEL